MCPLRKLPRIIKIFKICYKNLKRISIRIGNNTCIYHHSARALELYLNKEKNRWETCCGENNKKK